MFSRLQAIVDRAHERVDAMFDNTLSSQANMLETTERRSPPLLPLGSQKEPWCSASGAVIGWVGDDREAQT